MKTPGKFPDIGVFQNMQRKMPLFFSSVFFSSSIFDFGIQEYEDKIKDDEETLAW